MRQPVFVLALLACAAQLATPFGLLAPSRPLALRARPQSGLNKNKDVHRPLSSSAERGPSTVLFSSSEPPSEPPSPEQASDGAVEGAVEPETLVADPDSFWNTMDKIEKEQEQEKFDSRATGLTSEDQADYDSRADQFAAMRQRIVDRAGELGVEKSANSAENIGKAAEEAAWAARTSSELDISAFAKAPEDYSTPKTVEALQELFGGGKKDEDELTDMEMEEADPLSKLPFFQGLFEELKLIEWPKPKAVAIQAVVTVVALAFMVVFILTIDHWVQVRKGENTYFGKEKRR